MPPNKALEWPTLLLLIVCYAAWLLATLVPQMWLGWGLLTITLVLHSSLQHEALHGHPTKRPWLNEVLVYPALGLTIPYRRFKDTHLAHHRDERLTDPHDDPESNYLDPLVWHGLSRPWRFLLSVNNSLAGRMLLGPAIGLTAFYRSDWQLIRQGDRRVLDAYRHHVIGLVPVIIWMATVSAMPIWAYLAAAYAALSVLRIRTFLEHRAHTECDGRTVIIEDRGPLAWLFLNNNLHAVHHHHPRVAWYRLPGLYQERRDAFLRGNHGYRYRSYGEIFKRFFWRTKDPVPHPLRPDA